MTSRYAPGIKPRKMNFPSRPLIAVKMPSGMETLAPESGSPVDASMTVPSISVFPDIGGVIGTDEVVGALGADAPGAADSDCATVISVSLVGDAGISSLDACVDVALAVLAVVATTGAGEPSSLAKDGSGLEIGVKMRPATVQAASIRDATSIGLGRGGGAKDIPIPSIA